MVTPIRRNHIQAHRYRDFLKGKSIVVVGPAGYLQGSGLGEWIDSHDYVVRLNWGAPVPVEQKKDLGSRTDILYKRLLKLGHIDFIDLDEWYSEKMQWVIAVDRGQQNLSQRYFENKMVNSNIQYIIERSMRGELHQLLTTSPFIGMVAIAHLLKHDISSLDVVGIDFYRSGYSPGYGGREYRQTLHRKEGTPSPRHNVAKQMKWLADLAKTDSRVHYDQALTEVLQTVPKAEKLVKGPHREKVTTVKPARRTPVDVMGIIPARYESTRFPGKPLAEIHGKPMILWTCEAVSRALSYFAVATDDPRVAQVVSDAGYQVVMTKAAMTGTDRIAQVAAEYKAKVYVDIQGDEPLVDPNDIQLLVAAKRRYPTEVIVGVKRLYPDDDISAPSTVKVAMNVAGRIIYASRLPIPGNKDGAVQSPQYWKHTGLVAFNGDELRLFAGLKKKGDIEAYEDVETLRFLELGIRLRGVEVLGSDQAVDLPEHIRIVEERMFALGLVPDREAIPV